MEPFMREALRLWPRGAGNERIDGENDDALGRG